MSLASAGENIWKCSNPDCPPLKGIPPEVRVKFQICPVCSSPQKTTAGDDPSLSQPPCLPTNNAGKNLVQEMTTPACSESSSNITANVISPPIPATISKNTKSDAVSQSQATSSETTQDLKDIKDEDPKKAKHEVSENTITKDEHSRRKHSLKNKHPQNTRDKHADNNVGENAEYRRSKDDWCTRDIDSEKTKDEAKGENPIKYDLDQGQISVEGIDARNQPSTNKDEELSDTRVENFKGKATQFDAKLSTVDSQTQDSSVSPSKLNFSQDRLKRESINSSKPEADGNRNIGPPCQSCNKNLLSQTARICEHCKYVQRKIYVEESASCETAQQKFVGHASKQLKSSTAIIESDRIQNTRKRSSSLSDLGCTTTSKQFKSDDECSLGAESTLKDKNPSLQPTIYIKPKVAGDLLSPQSSKGNKGKAQNSKVAQSTPIKMPDAPGDQSKLSGLATGQGKFTEIVFHVIVPKPHWEWNQSSKIYLRFGCKELGDWNENVGYFNEREINENFCEMTCRLQVKVELLTKAIPYKYCVFTPKSLAQQKSYEFLHDIHQLNGKYLNRFLQLNQKKIKHGGIYHQYDTMVFPEDLHVSGSLKETIVTGISTGLNKMMTFFGFKFKSEETAESKQELRVLSNLSMRCQCFLIYLEKYQSILLSGFSHGITIYQFIEGVSDVYNALLQTKVTYRKDVNSHHDRLRVFDEEVKPVREWFLAWLQPCVDRFSDLPTEKQLVHAACIAWCIVKLKIPVSIIAGFSSVILECLHVCAFEPEKDSQQWKEYDCLCLLVPRSHKQMLAEAVLTFAVESTKEKQFTIERLFGMPLVNFLTDTSQPYDNVCSKDYEELFKAWNVTGKKFCLDEIRLRVSKTSIRFCDKYYPALRKLFDLDYFVLIAFIYICPFSELQQMFNKIPPHLSIAWLSYVITELNFSVSSENVDTVLLWLSTIEEVLKADMLKRSYPNPFIMVSSALSFFTRCTVMFMSPCDYYLAIISASVSLTLKAIALYIESKGEKNIKNVFDKMSKNLQEWISSYRVVGGTVFGQLSSHRFSTTLKTCKTEVEIWKSLLTVTCSGVKVIEPWHRIIREILSKRIKGVPHDLVVDLLQFVDNNSEDHEILTTVVMDAAIVAAENILLKSHRNATDNFKRFTQPNYNSKLLGSVLGTILKKKYIQLNKADDVNDWITLDVLLDWDLWPNYIKIVQQDDAGARSQLHEGLQDECQIACVCASTKFDDICTELLNGNVSLFDLRKMKTKEVRLRRLCEAVAGQGDKQFSYKDVVDCLNQRLEEFEKFSARRQAYLDICLWIPDPKQINGINQLKVELEQNYEDQKIKNLCRVENGILNLSCIHAAKPLDPFVDHFGIMQSKGSNLFLQRLKHNMKYTLLKPNLTIADIYPLIWQPTFEFCQKLLNDLASLQLTLAFVDQYLRPFSPTLQTEVKNLANGMRKCTQGIPDIKALNVALSKVTDYWKICEYQEGAQVFLDLKNILNLNGDFSLIQKFAVDLEMSMKDETLSSIDSDLVKTGKFLKEIVDKPARKNCLMTFVKCQDIVQWLRKTTKSVNDIQGFVTVALATAAGGEGDMVTDQLSNLRNVGSGFASLIYDVPNTAGYPELMQKCESLWTSVENTPKLPELLEECNISVSWYQSVKETQGSVETTSYGQMTNILKYGIYRVGFKENAQTVHDLISVTLIQSHHAKQLLKTSYTLDELRDLESKLVLICGNKAETRAEVDHYLDLLHCVTRIAELYLDLLRAGYVEYSNTGVEFRCAVYDILRLEVKDLQFNEVKAKKRVLDLQDYTRNLEKQLKSWKNSVDTAREKYYELNYFTTLQLLELRKELGILAKKVGTLKPSVLMLLKSVSPNLSDTVVFQLLHTVDEECEVIPMEESVENVAEAVVLNTVNEVQNAIVDAPTPTPLQLSSTLEVSPSAKPLIPALTFEDLDERQQRNFTYLVERLGHSESHVLQAFQERGQDANLYDVEEWCENNEDQSPVEHMREEEDAEEMFVGDDYDIIYHDTDTDYKMDTSNPSDSILQESCIDHSTVEGDQLSFVDPVLSSVCTVVRESIDESHPDVQELIGAGYDLQAAVKAMNKFRDVEEAMEYLNTQEREEADKAEDTKNGGVLKSMSREPNSLHPGDIDDVEHIFVVHCSKANKSHLKLDQLGRLLQAISARSPGAVSVPRMFDSSLLKAGLPNLLVTSSDNVLRSILALYTADPDLSLPTLEEVLLCTKKTTTEEVTLLWRRAIGDPEHRRVFCLAHAEKLSFQVCEAALRSLAELSQDKKDYRLVVICSKDDEDKSRIISRLHTFRRPVIPRLDEAICRKYLKAHFTLSVDSSQTPAQHSAATVDLENSCVRVVSSTRSGMGKSLFIKRRAEQLCQLTSNENSYVIIPIHGPVVTSDTLLEFFNQHTERDVCTLYHLDIAPRVLPEVDYLLFSLLIMGGLNDSKGHVWRNHSSQMYLVEVTLPEKIAEGESYQTLNLLSLLPTVECVSPVIVEQREHLNPSVLGMDQEEFCCSKIQRVYQYLKKYSMGQSLHRFSYHPSVVEEDVPKFLKIVLSKCGIRDPSWLEIHHFTKFLDVQLHSCENSVFCNEDLVADVMSGLKDFVVKFMIRMSQDFSTPSLEGVLARENQEKEVEIGGDDQLNQYQIVRRRQWEQNSHPYIFFNDDCISITFVGFRVTETGDLVDPSTRALIEPAIMTPKLYTGLKQNRVNLDEDYHGWSKYQMITKIATVMGIEYPYDPDESYVLTTDNLVKMLAIQMRFRCDIPVVIMGETGCGKTRLIRYMCDLARRGRDLKNMLILKIHGGITDQNVIDFVKDAEEAAQANKDADPKLGTVVFFDEANTTESIGLIKEIMCDRRMNGRAISRDLKFIAACNPYRKHTKEMIEKLEAAGLGFYVRETETQQKLGKTPLRQLVYRVLDLPPSMAPLVYDFGQLNTGTEYDYTCQIVKDHVSRHSDLKREPSAIIPAISKVLAESQQFMRDQKNDCSFVSLRDVERAMIVFEFFYEKSSLFASLRDKKSKDEFDEKYGLDEDIMDEKIIRPTPPKSPSNITRALLLSLSVCYHARLQDRERYEDCISHFFRDPLALPGGAEQFREEIKWCQEGLLDSMVLGQNIAKNAALRENVFMMAICIELRIPLFLVGKPGSSKSLAKSIIQDSMHGQGSQHKILKEFKQVHIFSYQCSQLSTPESVIEVFNSAKRFQAKQDIKQYVSVVVLDEVGLAEDSPSLPLKALHPLLEDGTEGSGKDHQQQTVEREQRVAFIGISNWALDPAKMNRGVMVTRGEPKEEELILSAQGICSTKKKDPVRDKLHPYFGPLSKAYLAICDEQERQFFGLRDYYSLIKMLYWMCEKSKGNPLSSRQLEHAIKRNFGGLETNDMNPWEIFMKAVLYVENTENIPEDDYELQSEMNPDCSRLGLIRTSLKTKDTTWHGENRYLLFLTENYAALNILKQYLNVWNEGDHKSNDLISQPYILFGSSFPKDKEYTQVCRNINQIKICMETGRTVILLNLENLYESLYDVLNQYYMYSAGVRYVDLGLQTHRVKCRVHDNFKLILIAEKDTVYNKFPIPLINRLEKHFVLTSSVLEGWQHSVLKEFEEWIQAFSRTSDYFGNQFKEAHAFIGYQNDTPAAVVFQATNLLKRLVDKQWEREYFRLQEASVLSEDLYSISISDKQWCESVLSLSKFLLLQTAVDDALVRLKKSRLHEEEVKRLKSLYFDYQHHRSLRDFLKYECRNDRDMFIQVTTHCPLMTYEELKTETDSLSMDFAYFDLHEFDTELDFSTKIGPKFLRKKNQSQPFLMVLECDSGHLNSDLIACARYRVFDEAIKANSKHREDEVIRNSITHVLFVIKLPQQEVSSQFVGFQGDPWISVHIDDLRPICAATITPEHALTAKISDLFIGGVNQLVESQTQDISEIEAEMSCEYLKENMKYHEKTKISPFAEHDRSLSEFHEENMSVDSSAEVDMHENKSDGEENVSKSRSSSEEPQFSSLGSIAKNDEMELDESHSIFTRTQQAFINLPSIDQPNDVEIQDIEEMTTEELNAPEELTNTLSVVDNSQIENSAASDIFSHHPTVTKPVIPVSSSSVPIESEDMLEKSPRSVLKIKPFHAQHQRLLGCVQAAVSMLKDSEVNRSMLRIQKLMALIPKTPTDQLDETSFYGLLVRFIYNALKQREEVWKDDWVLVEAMSGRKLQSGGTFRNVLARRIDEIITPFFAELIVHFDQNCNLNLLDPVKQTPISLFWLEMFELTGSQVDFSSLVKGKTDIKTTFPCQLPFSWFVKREVDAQKANILNADLVSFEKALCETEIGNILKKVSEDNVQNFYERYLYDFVRYVYQSGNKGDLEKVEYKLIMDALDVLTHNPDLCSVDGRESLTFKIVALHLVYSWHSTKVMQFGQLVMHRPGILQALSNAKHTSNLRDNQDFTLHLKAVQQVLESDQEDDPHDPTNQTLAGLNPPLHKEKQAEITQNIRHWLNHVRLSQNIIDTILRSSPKSEDAIRARLTWQRVRALQIFAEKVYLPNCEVEGIDFIIRRLEIILKINESDFLKKKTLNGVKLLLNNMFSVKKFKVAPSAKGKIKLDCNRFFIEIVSSLCFGGKEAPEPDLVRELLDTVLHDTQTSKLSPYNEPDKTPTIRSFLLQLLLEKECSQVEEFLDDYFNRSLKVIGNEPDQRLCLLCIQCLEDAFSKQVHNDNISHEVAQILEESFLSLIEHGHTNDPPVTVQYLRSVAGVRFGLSVAAEQFKNGHIDDRLLRITRDLCIDHRVNVIDPSAKVDVTGPVLYLLKLIVRRYGFSVLDAVSEAHPWLVPEALKKGEEEKSIDPFILYGKEYVELRSAVSAVTFTKKTDKLTDCAKDELEPSLLIIAIYQKVTLLCASRVPAKQVHNEALQILNAFIQESSELTPDMIHISRLLLANQQGGQLAQLTISPYQPSLCRVLSDIVIHFVSVVSNKVEIDLLLPFLNMLNNPMAIKNAFLPTMAEDLLEEVKAIGGSFYECPNGHPYLIGDCGKPVEERYCNECHAKIGGTNYKLATNNKTARASDATKTGYDLGHPDRRSPIPERERDLSAPVVCMVRAFMHSAFIWASCNNEEELIEISELTKRQVPPGDLAEFFWLHLERDLECLSRSTGKGLEECTMILHLVLHRMLKINPPSSPTVAKVKHLKSKVDRREWEKLFSKTYISPILENVDVTLKKAFDIIANDTQQEHDQLFYLAHEKVKVDETKLQAHQWTFRQPINLEHLQRKIQKKRTPVLDAFLRTEPSLRATQYLPDIVKLQHFLFDFYNKRLQREKAKTFTIKNFLHDVKCRFNENTKNEFQVKIESLKKAWTLVCHKLKTHNRLRIEEQYLLPKITLNTPIIYLIPTTVGEGKCTTVLVDYLVSVHNNFIEHCCTVVSEGAGSAAAVWREHKVPITHLHSCHMLEYEQHLQSVILSHCHYSLAVGKGQNVEYDLPALEQHILDRFIYGKPVVQLDIPSVAYRKDIYTVESFLEIRRKVKPQVVLDQRVQQDIVAELGTPDKLRESLDVVDIVLGLLSSGGGAPKLSLKQFIDSRRMDGKSFSTKAKEHCTLGHIISLWETLSVELARQRWTRALEPFEEIPDGYNNQLSETNRRELDECLRTFNLGLLLGVMFEFIEVHVKQISDLKQKDYELVNALDDYWGMTDQKTYSRDTLKGFPLNITVDQAVATWKYIADYKVKCH